ncbi:aspartyl protease family protein [uncultured Draconibacterium sp.]|uniref:retropepsin-like aspartic protease n=1 Tax=uncultured Draconibacterium sp. TaxID=1573823 RepID=UPI0025F586CB|nr:aspartyl protease family protein [uncultured Draconibacterium sp.]
MPTNNSCNYGGSCTIRIHSKSLTLLLAGILILLFSACSVKWTEAIRYGSVAQHEIKETVDIDIQKRLIILPVTLNGKEYRFLFDTGAPFCISGELQEENNFKIISKGKIVDSDKNKKQVDWAQVDSVFVGDVLFLNQTAFVGDFEANPIMKCLEIDGIIGSNFIRHCNWMIDQENNTLSLLSSINENGIVIPFNTDHQYNIFIDVNFGRARVKNILVDYGSNGSVALSNEIFTTFTNKNIIDAEFSERGIKQSGIIGESVELKRKLTFSDSVRIDNLELKNVLIQTGETVSVGNQLLSRFQLTIDWNNKNLYLTKPEKEATRIGLAGFRLGSSTDKGIYVQSVIEESNAYKSGIRPNMKVIKIDSLDFENGNDFCDYVEYDLKDEIYMQLIDSEGKKLDYYFNKTF